MRSLKSRRAFLVQALACVPVVAFGVAADDKAKPAAKVESESYQVRLIWASNDASSPDPSHKKLDSELTTFLKKSFKWSSYYEVNSKVVSVPLNKTEDIKLSDACTVKVKNLGKSQMEAELFGKGKAVSKSKGELKKWFILAGEDKNDTGWFVVIRKVPDPK
ncbi:MAG TPA: hypothetical protein VGH19_03705 [Verrucomicrobiae bacterium]